MTETEDLAKQIDGLRTQLQKLTRTTTLTNASVAQAQGTDSIDVADAADTAIDTSTTVPGLQDSLDSLTSDLSATKDAVSAAHDAATQAGIDGIAAGDLASEAAQDALDKAQQALDAAASAGGGNTYTGRAPTSDDAGKPGQGWFVWDSNYHVTAYYVYKDDTDKWVQTVLDDGTFGNLSAGHITSGFLDAARIAAGSLTAAVLAADTLTSREIGADAILARNIKAAVITGDKIAARTIAASNIVAGTITGNEIAANTITATQIQANSITANEINLNTLNGKTITGALIKTAASGQRLELLGTRLDVYGAGATAAASIVGIPGIDSSATSTIQITGKNGAGTSATSNLHGPFTLGTCTYNATFSHGINTTHVLAKRLFTSTSSITPVLVINGTDDGVVVTADAYQTRDGASILTGSYAMSMVLQNAVTLTGTTLLSTLTVDDTTRSGFSASDWKNGVLTMPVGSAGMYLITASIRVLSGTTSNQVFVALNGTSAGSRIAFQDGPLNATLTFPYRLADGDVLRPYGYSSGTAQTEAIATKFTVYKIGN